jgi:hypothetical protein
MEIMAMSDVLTSAWNDIRKRHRSIANFPRPVIAITPSPKSSTCGSVTWGHEPVLVVGIRTLEEQPTEIMGWLLHQAAHGLADMSRPPTSARTGRYHDRAYGDAAALLGLAVDTGPGIDWSQTSMTPELAATYAPTIARISHALDGWEPPKTPAREAHSARNPSVVAAVCRCSPPRRIRAARSTLETGLIRCEICGEEFAAEGSLIPGPGAG